MGRTTYRSLFAMGEFRVLFASTLLYGLGGSLEVLGLSVLVYARSRSALLAAVAFGIGFVPQLVGGALLTSLADRLPPRAVLSGGLACRAMPGLVIGLAPGLSVGAMFALVAAAALVSPLLSASSGSLLAEVVDGDRYVLGRSVFNLTSSVSQLAALGMGGILLVAFSARQLLLTAGASVLLGALWARLRLQYRPPAGSFGHGVVRGTIAGNKALLSDRRLRGLYLAVWLPPCILTGAESLIVPYVGSQGHPASAASDLLAAMPIGMLAGDLVVGRWCAPRTRERLSFPVALVMGLPLVGFAFRPGLALAALLIGLTGAGFAYTLGIQQPFLDAIPDGRRAQAFGLRSAGLMGGQGLSPPVAGALTGIIGIGGAIALAGATTTAVTLALHDHLWRARTTKSPAAERPPLQ